jgi:hypothetical protein
MQAGHFSHFAWRREIDEPRARQSPAILRAEEELGRGP